MRRIKIGFRGPVPSLITGTRDKVTKINGNPYFTTPFPTLADVTTAVDAVEVAYNDALAGDRDKKEILRIRVAALKVLIFQLADYVQNTSAGDAEIIISSGFELRKLPATVEIPEVPVAVTVSPAQYEGELEVLVKASNRARAYAFRMQIGSPSEQAEIIGVSMKGKFIARNLPSLTRIWFSVCALNSSGASGWSDPAMGITR